MASNLDKKRKSTAISNHNSSSSSYQKYNKASSSYSSTIQNPKRGGPGILLTCETGREYKARREALQILQQDWEIHGTTAKNTTITTTTTTTTTSIVPQNEALQKNTPDTQPPPPPETSVSGSLDAELAQLQKQQSRSTFSSLSSSPDSPFVIYETGCKGTVLILYQSPNTTTRTTAPSVLTLTNNNETTTTVEHISCNNGDIKTTLVEKPGTQNVSNLDTNQTVTDEVSKSEDNIKVEWDPLVVVQRIVEDMTLKSPKYTSSRYISRMIPIQRTCYATIEDISVVVQSLLEPIVARQNYTPMDHTNNNTTTTLTTSRNLSLNPSPPAKTTTFAIQEKRRFCNQMKRDALITAVGNVVGAVTKGYNSNNDKNNNDMNNNDSSSYEWTVNLSQPDYTIWIDICKTVAGISIVPNLQSSYPKNFNLVEHRISLLNHAEEPDTEPHPSASVTEDIP